MLVLDLYQELGYLFFLLSICTDELISTPKIMTFLPQWKFESEKSESKSNPLSLPLYTYLSGSAFLINLRPPNKQSFKAKSEFNTCGHIFNS